jgi:hypothetical protein
VNANPNIPAARSPVSGATAGAAKSTAPAAPATFSPCPDCEGTGFFVIGEFHPDDPRSSATYDCESCGGSGEADDPTWDEFVAPFRRLADGYLRVEL